MVQQIKKKYPNFEMQRWFNSVIITLTCSFVLYGCSIIVKVYNILQTQPKLIEIINQHEQRLDEHQNRLTVLETHDYFYQNRAPGKKMGALDN